MNPVTLIKKKRSGQALTPEEWSFFIGGYTAGAIPDYQMSALLMAIFFAGMNAEETAQLVDLMKNSGSTVDLSRVRLPKIDKHSTGGIGDKTTLILGPLLASCGVAYPTIAGRGLGHTGGTIDKLQAIPGYRTELSIDEFRAVLADCGFVMAGAAASTARNSSIDSSVR